MDDQKVLERRRRHHPQVILMAIALGFGGAWQSAVGLDRLTVKQDGATRLLVGKVVTEAVDGGVLLMTPDGRMWPIQPQEILERDRDELPFKPLTRDEMEKLLLKEFPGFKVHETNRYLICYNTSLDYAKWCGALFERLHRGFQNFWNERGLPVHNAELPLVAMVFNSRESYAVYVRHELGDATDSIGAFFSPTSNRMNLYDATGIEEYFQGQRVRKSDRINQILSSPSAVTQVATIVHEAAHQLCFNCGVQTRLADNPLWVSEGLAVYFETPDLKSTNGWSSIGRLNAYRLQQFRQYQRTRSGDSLELLLRDDKRFHDPKTATDAYAEAWALNYYLFKARRNDYVAYLKQLAAKPAAVIDTPEFRLEQFQAIFGNLEKFDAEFMKGISAIR